MLTDALDNLIRAFQKIDKTILERVLGTHDHQAVLLDELFEQLRPVPQSVSWQILLGAPHVEFFERLLALRTTAGLRMNGGGYSGVSPSALLRSRLAIGRRELDFKLMNLIPLGVSALALRHCQKLLQASAGGASAVAHAWPYYPIVGQVPTD